MKYHPARRITINAPVEKVRPQIADFKKWNKWSSWNVIDPEQKNAFEGKTDEVGHKMI